MLTSARRLGAGGEAEVFEVADRPALAAKLYRRPTVERARKLRVMLANPPEGTDAGGHVAIAWPTELVLGADGGVDGFLMPRIDLAATVPLFQVYNPATRVRIAPAFTWRYLLRTARNVAAIVDSLHRAGYVVGDINESNLLVNRRALAVLVDCDSMQVRDPVSGAVLRGGVGKPEFTAPELHGRDLSTTDRTVASDDFALAVLVFQLLMEGVHPFAGIWRGRGEPPDVAARIRSGLFPYRRGARVVPPPRALSLEVLPRDLRRLVWRAFTTGVRRPSARPTAGEWAAALEAAGERLRSCPRSEHHVYADHRRACPWCDRIDAGFPDPFPGPTGTSALVPRPPPLPVRVRAAASSATRSAWSTIGRKWSPKAPDRALLATTCGRAASWAWRHLRAPLLGPIPTTLALAALGALVPVAALALWLLGAMSSAWRTHRAQTLLGPALDAAVAVAIATAALMLLTDGQPPWRLVLATTGALLATKTTRWGGFGRQQWPIVAWAGAAGGLLALGVHGPVWWPLP